MGRGWLLYAGPLATTRPHAHHAFQVMLTGGRPFALVDGAGETTDARTLVVPPGAPHAVATTSDAAVLLHVDPDTLEGRSLKALGLTPAAASWAGPTGGLHPLTRTPLPRRWEEGEALAQAILSGLLGRAPRPVPVHPALQRALRVLPAHLEAEDVRLGALAAAVGLSPDRLSHLFADELQLGFRPYVLWLRLQRAAAFLSRGGTLTEAAHAAGFSDSAHLSHTFRRMFGLAPSRLAHAVEWVLPPSEARSPGGPGGQT